MDNEADHVSETFQELTQAEAAAFDEFRREMTEEVIPEILKVVQERRVLASESRQWQLKT